MRGKKDGVHYAPPGVSFEPVRLWKSPRTGVEYPVSMKVKNGNTQLLLEPLMDDQELDARTSAGTIYWEGAVRALRNGQPIWLFSPETLRRVPAVYGQIDVADVESYLPRPLRDSRRCLACQWWPAARDPLRHAPTNRKLHRSFHRHEFPLRRRAPTRRFRDRPESKPVVLRRTDRL